MAYPILQQEAIDFVEANKARIYSAISWVNKKLTWEDREDCLSQGYVVALELTHQGKSIYDVEDEFWRRIFRFAYDDYDYLVDNLNIQDIDSRVKEASSRNQTQHIERWEFESQLSAIVDVIASILSPAEGRVFRLVVGETSDGCCSLGESAKILGSGRGQPKSSPTGRIKRLRTQQSGSLTMAPSL